MRLKWNIIRAASFDSVLSSECPSSGWESWPPERWWILLSSKKLADPHLRKLSEIGLGSSLLIFFYLWNTPFQIKDWHIYLPTQNGLPLPHTVWELWCTGIHYSNMFVRVISNLYSKLSVQTTHSLTPSRMKSKCVRMKTLGLKQHTLKFKKFEKTFTYFVPIFCS